MLSRNAFGKSKRACIGASKRTRKASFGKIRIQPNTLAHAKVPQFPDSLINEVHLCDGGGKCGNVATTAFIHTKVVVYDDLLSVTLSIVSKTTKSLSHKTDFHRSKPIIIIKDALVPSPPHRSSAQHCYRRSCARYAVSISIPRKRTRLLQRMRKNEIKTSIFKSH